jgi:hypothetical protein
MLSECFIRSGIDLSLIAGKRCWSHSGTKHILLAEELAKGLKKTPPKSFGVATKISSTSFKSDLDRKTGMIFFKGYYRRDSEIFENRSGDHIDLWNKTKITDGSMLYRSLIEFFGLVSELGKSKEIWFWVVSE